jgi:ATP-dependent RNA helicase RhlE
MRLQEIQQFLNKEIEVVKVGKKDYGLTLGASSAKTGVEALIEEHEAWLKTKRKKKKSRK